MEAIKDDQGNLLGVSPSHIMVPPALRWTAESIFGKAAGSTTTPTDAVLEGVLKVFVNPYLTSATTWYVMDLTQPVLPFIFQDREALQFVALDAPTDAEVFWRKKYYYSVEARFVFGF